MHRRRNPAAKGKFGRGERVRRMRRTGGHGCPTWIFRFGRIVKPENEPTTPLNRLSEVQIRTKMLGYQRKRKISGESKFWSGREGAPHAAHGRTRMSDLDFWPQQDCAGQK